MKKIAILKWWPWLEREVALKSAAYIEEHLECSFDSYTLPEELDQFIEHRAEYDKVIPVFHWEYWEDGKIQGFLEILWIPYAYSDFDTHALLLDKYNTNIIARGLGLQVANDFLLKKRDFTSVLGKTLQEITAWMDIEYPMIFKPNKWWSSFFTYKIHTDIELNEKIEEAILKLDDDILLQNFVNGDEYSTPIANWEFLPIMKLEKSEPDLVFDYDSKYETEALIQETFPDIPSVLSQKLKKHTQLLWDHFDMKDFVRIDYIVSGNDCYFLDANTIPWMSAASITPQAWKLAWKTDKEFAEVLAKR